MFRDRIRSFGYAFRGIWVLFRGERNAQIHLLATVVATAGGFMVGLSPQEWTVLVLTIVGVLTAEAFNTAVEFLADAVIPERHPLIKKAKDVAAGAVLLTAIASIVVGVLLFGPRLL